MKTNPSDDAEPQERVAYTIKQFAATLGISTCAVYDAVARGEVKAGRLGGRILIPVAELQRVLSPASAACA